VSRRVLPALVVLIAASAVLTAQSRPPSSPSLEFEVASIKRNTTGTAMSLRTLPSGDETLTNVTAALLVGSAYPTDGGPTFGLPAWTSAERYDVIVKPPHRPSREERVQMWRTLLADRMKLEAHYETRQQDSYDLVLARRDGQLGPQLKPSALDCSQPARAGGPGGPAGPPTPEQAAARCGFMGTGRGFYSGAMTVAALAGMLRGAAGRYVVDKTGLQGNYSVSLTYAPPAMTPGAAADATPDEAPSIFTALEEQLGLKLQPSTTAVRAVVVDHVERPTEN
jgi:uncharacterized protein (TIGR03435 family)